MKKLCDECGNAPAHHAADCRWNTAAWPLASDEHRYVITAPWGDEAEADTYDAALAARRQLGNDAHDAGIEWSGWLDSIKIIDRGYAPQEG